MANAAACIQQLRAWQANKHSPCQFFIEKASYIFGGIVRRPETICFANPLTPEWRHVSRSQMPPDYAWQSKTSSGSRNSSYNESSLLNQKALFSHPGGIHRSSQGITRRRATAVNHRLRPQSVL